MKIYKIDSENPDTKTLNIAVDTLHRGSVVAYLTDTLYGLGVDASLPQAIEKIYTIKERSSQKALPIIIGDRNMLTDWVQNIPKTIKPVLDKFWPGPLTVILPATKVVPAILTARTGKIAVRLPDSMLSKQLSMKLGGPIVATSANFSGMPEALTANDVVTQLGDSLPCILDSGKARHQTPSTILDATVTPVKLIRAGGIATEAFIPYLGDI